jgi:hypothetical protein
VHYVASTRDAPPDRAWANTTLRVMSRVWRAEVHRMGYRPPPRDGKHGGDGRFDVYLKELGSQGLYGYCAPEYRVDGLRHVASGYCVLDDDFARAQFGAVPQDSLRVTAAHEFAHASQFNYDYLEDSWFMEATATWMEERVYDAVNDNRQYLRAGQVGSPDQPLDVFDPRGSNQYGNWAFFEHLSSRWGVGIVREAWNHAGGVGVPNQYSTEAVKSVLAARGGFPAVYSAFAAANTRPAQTYEEGAAWPSAQVASTWTIGSSDRTRQDSALVDHLAARNLRAVPGATLGAGWRLRVVVDGPAADTSPTASVTVDRTGDLPTQTSPVPLDADGRGTATVAFDPTSVDDVTVTLANASTRFACHQGTYLSCEGSPRDDDGAFTLQVVALQP